MPTDLAKSTLVLPDSFTILVMRSARVVSAMFRAPFNYDSFTEIIIAQNVM
jgi:hypothetical protein